MGKNGEKVGKDRIVVGLKYQSKVRNLDYPVVIGNAWILNLHATYSQ